MVQGLIELRMSELSADGKLGMKVDGIPAGLQVQKINAPNAQTAGFLEGDIIVKVDGVQAPGVPAVRAAAERIKAGKTVLFTVERPPYSSGMSNDSTPRSAPRPVMTRAHPGHPGAPAGA